MVTDNPAQTEIALKTLASADVLAISLPTLCEFAWVLRSSYGFKPVELGKAFRAVLSVANVITNRPAVEFGLAILEAGGDFADGVIAFEGRWLGGETFVSFDRKAVAILQAQGQPATLLV